MLNNDQEGFYDEDYGESFLPRDFRGFEFDEIDTKHTTIFKLRMTVHI